MDQQNQAPNSYSPSDVTVKKKRGRPRKDKSQNPAKAVYVPCERDPSQNYGNRAAVPPGFESTNGHQPHPVATNGTEAWSVPVENNNNADSLIGQVVTGVIEAVFDAGYLLSVRIGESDTLLRGVVFQAGHYVPVSAENDIAPSLQMIRRNEVPFPVGAQRHKHRGREESDRHAAYPSNGPSSSNQVSRVRARQMAIVAAPTPGPSTFDSRGTVVPVVLQPMNLSNGAAPAVEAPPISSKPAHLAATAKIKNRLPSHIVPVGVPKISEIDNDSASHSFEELVSAAKKIKGPAETQNGGGESSSKMLPNDSSLAPEKVGELGKPLVVKPLQTILPGLPHQSASVSHTFPERRGGKMTELLRAVEVNSERQMPDSQHPEFGNPDN